jgi:hypothetical protein
VRRGKVWLVVGVGLLLAGSALIVLDAQPDAVERLLSAHGPVDVSYRLDHPDGASVVMRAHPQVASRGPQIEHPITRELLGIGCKRDGDGEIVVTLRAPGDPNSEISLIHMADGTLSVTYRRPMSRIEALSEFAWSTIFGRDG